MSDPLVEKLTFASFAPLIQTRFQVEFNPERSVELELTAATEIQPPGGPEKLSQEAFSLLFTGPETPFLPQGTYWFRHDRIGRFILFLVPVGKQAGQIEYQVIFNRLIRAD